MNSLTVVFFQLVFDAKYDPSLDLHRATFPPLGRIVFLNWKEPILLLYASKDTPILIISGSRSHTAAFLHMDPALGKLALTSDLSSQVPGHP